MDLERADKISIILPQYNRSIIGGFPAGMIIIIYSIILSNYIISPAEMNNKRKGH